MIRIIRIAIIGILFSAISGIAMAFWFSGPGGYVNVPLPQEATSPTTQSPTLNTNTVFVLTADSFVDDQGNPLNLRNTSFSHGMGVVTKQIETFQKIAQSDPGLSSTILQIATFDGKTLAIYDANGPIADPSKISPDSKRIVIFIADIQGDTVNKDTGKISFSADSVYKTLTSALEALKKTNSPVLVNLSLSAGEPVQALQDLMSSYPNALFVASADGWPGNYAENLNNVVSVGSTSDPKNGATKNTVYAEGRVEVTNQETGLPETAYGRSFAVPQGVITAALAWQQNGNLSAADVKNIIIGPTLVATADSPATGELNPQASVGLAKSFTPSSPPIGNVSFQPPTDLTFGFIW